MKNIHCLYIHGLDSFPVPQKIQVLKDAGIEVFALTIDYRKEEKAYQILERYALENDINFIIGSSFGGYLGFWLSEKLGIPCLLFNPALAFRSIDTSLVPTIEERNCPLRMMVLGIMDETVHPNLTLEWLNNFSKGTTEEKIITCHWLAHHIDIHTFESICLWSLVVVNQLFKSTSK